MTPYLVAFSLLVLWIILSLIPWKKPGKVVDIDEWPRVPKGYLDETEEKIS